MRSIPSTAIAYSSVVCHLTAVHLLCVLLSLRLPACLQDVDEEELTVEEAKERKIMKLLLKVKNGTPPQRKSALRQLTGGRADGWAGGLGGLSVEGWAVGKGLGAPCIGMQRLAQAGLNASGSSPACTAPQLTCPPPALPPAACPLPADKARDFGAGPLFNQILPLLMSPTLEDQERHLLVKVGLAWAGLGCNAVDAVGAVCCLLLPVAVCLCCLCVVWCGVCRGLGRDWPQPGSARLPALCPRPCSTHPLTHSSLTPLSRPS